MFVTFDEYKSFGYDILTEDNFKKIAYKAGLMVKTLTLERVTDKFLNPDEEPDLDTKEIIDFNKRGICEIADLIFQNELKPLGEAGVPIVSFRNEGYSESYGDNKDSFEIFNQNLKQIMSMFFTREQLSRLVV